MRLTRLMTADRWHLTADRWHLNVLSIHNIMYVIMDREYIQKGVIFE